MGEDNKKTCAACRDGKSFDVPITMAYQPIANMRDGTIFAYEALLRGADGSGAGAILAQVNDDNRYAFDQKCRVTAIEIATRLGWAADGPLLSINFLPNAVYEPRACIRLTLETAMRTGFPLDRIMFEFTETEKLDVEHLLNILQAYRSLGFKTAIDDFGAGFAGLELLSKFQPDVVKLDMALIRDIDQSSIKQTILKNTLKMVTDLGSVLVCEGVETREELDVLRDHGVDLFQGYHLARPEIEALPKPQWDEGRPAAAA